MLLAGLWLAIDWSSAGSEDFPGGVILRDDAGTELRVTLGKGAIDCCPTYRADPEDWIAKAVVASEDRTFWDHWGVRPLSVVRAALQNLFGGRRISGASTITMQTVRLIRPHPKTFWWKVKEAVMAMKVERVRDKRWIMSQYLNRAPFGSNFVGIEAAARGWFGKGAKELGLGEAAMLAGMLQAPSRFRPDYHYDRALKRRDYVLGRMLEDGVIDADQLAAAKSVLPKVRRARRPYAAPHFCDWVLWTRELGQDETTTLNADIQRCAEQAVAHAAARSRYSVAAVVMRVDSGAVQALACSGDYFSSEGGQIVTPNCLRPAGSTLKPLLTALAMDRGLVTPEQRMADVPRAYQGYRPANFDGQHRGLVSVRDSLILSLNLPFVQMLQQVGVPEFGHCLQRLGISMAADPKANYGLGMAIGNVEVTLMELVTAYASVARGGEWKPATALRPEAEKARTRPGERVLSAASCYLISDILSGDERSGALGHIAEVQMPRFAWKTGTSSAYRDAWTVAWNSEYVIGVWCGHLTGGFGDESLVGVKAAAPVALGLARSLYPQGSGPWFSEPAGIGRREVCALTGLPAGACCPQAETGRYLVGHSSQHPCEVHVRDVNGQVVERQDALVSAFSGQLAEAEKLQISKPENGSVFCLVPGMRQQQIVCQVVGNPARARLWWIVDGVVAGETVGLQPLLLDMKPGDHEVTCTSEGGVASSVGFQVVEP